MKGQLNGDVSALLVEGACIDGALVERLTKELADAVRKALANSLPSNAAGLRAPERPVPTTNPDYDLVLAGLITEQELARQRGVSLRTCQRDRAQRNSPPFIVVGRKVFYQITSARTWLLDRETEFRTSRPMTPTSPVPGHTRGRR